MKIGFEKDEPNIFIGINDCGKTTIVKAIGLLLEDKGSFNFIKDNSSKKDFSNSPLSKDDFDKILTTAGLPLMTYTGNETVIIGKFCIEEQDLDIENLSSYSNQLLWAIENSSNDILWFARVFQSNSANSNGFLVLPDYLEADIKPLEAWNLGVRELDKKIKELEISAEEILNENNKGRFTNLEKVRAIYSKLPKGVAWSSYKIEKGDKIVFPTFRYLDWNSSLDDIKKTAGDAMAQQLRPK